MLIPYSIFRQKLPCWPTTRVSTSRILKTSEFLM